MVSHRDRYMSTIRLFEVGGCVRDGLLGVPSKDVDFTVIATSFSAMDAHIRGMGLKVFISKEEFATIRAGVPKGHPLRERCTDADFVLARRDGPSSDGRRPDFVEPGTLLDDLSRRDFTVNAMARDPFTGELVDPHGGLTDLEARLLRFVGDPMTRIREDGLRVLRAFRFSVTKGFSLETGTALALKTQEAADMVQKVSIERVQIELDKMMRHDTSRSLRILGAFPEHLMSSVFRDGLRLGATLKQ